ncbi:MotA/TolQ/ExbB proton channel family protein [Halanaerobium congolense]|uniref:MotA/TolQ/ExbB proton channel family protein n=1 Tax=Halanaerobium congolense TaxID=54121 RepID=UPI00105F87EE|nr:MotA/TolQ/ExbB proton channel family protein [Halanaerobium congolense]TDP12513.1 MotA/TolQ/ExbB proton channel family protein [Halanaerobium congolense]
MVIINLNQLINEISITIGLSINWLIVIIFVLFTIGFTIYQWYKNILPTKNLKNNIFKLRTTLDKKLDNNSLNNILEIESLIGKNNFIINDILEDYIIMIKNNNNKNIIDPEHYINQNSIFSNFLNKKVSDNIPSTLTAIGILGTFFGLIIGLWNLNIANAENIRNSIPPLISSMQISFISSLVAIFCSIIYNYWNKKYNNITEKEINRLNNTLRKYLPIRIESNLIDNIVENQEKQLRATQEFYTDTLIPELVNGVKEAVDQSLKPSMNSIDNNLNNFVEASKENQKDMIEGVEKIVSESIAPQIEEMHNIMDNLADLSIDKQSESIDKMVDKFMKTFNESFDNQFTALRVTLEDMIRWQKESKKEMESLISTLEQGAVKQNDMLDYTEKLLNNVQQYVKQFYDLNANLNHNIKQLNTLGEKLSGLEEKTNDKLEILIEQQEKFDQKKNSHIDEMEIQLDNIEKYWDNVQSSFTELNNNFNGAIEQFADSTHESLERTFTSFDENLSEISDRLAVTITEVNNSLEDIPNSFNQLKNLLDEFKIDRKEILDVLDKQESLLGDKLTDISKAVQEENKKIETILEENNKNLKNDVKKEVENNITPISAELKEEREKQKEIIDQLNYIRDKMEENEDKSSFFSRLRGDN